ncbi:MAG: response regulator [Candidatus Andeanibacterium colombiense]|uniref:Response regulator n=1 Tax=Candidatus Andeanibacterium colombiense TaxID=3121345 RepID=A0AAJ6BQJ1_9SPHN|nr:MAG: response regulator [Sphingomonadaceae bacterium]
MSFAPTGTDGRGRRAERLLGKRVLIVEDEALLALELELAFADEGAEIVGPALSLSHGVMLAEAAPEIDCAVLDVDLGGRDVFPIAHALEQRGIPFIFHTAHARASTLTTLFPRSETVVKPARPEDLVLRLARISLK